MQRLLNWGPLRLVFDWFGWGESALYFLDGAHVGTEITCFAPVIAQTTVVVILLNKHLDWTRHAFESRTLVCFTDSIVLWTFTKLMSLLVNVGW